MPDLKSLLKGIPAAIRHAYLQRRLGALGQASEVRPGACFEYPKQVRLGEGCRIGRGALLRGNTDAADGIRVGDRSLVQEHALLNANRGHITIGSDSWIGPFCLLYGNGGIDIGNHVMVAAHTSINTVSHHAERADIPMSEQGTYQDPVVIEDDVWIGLHAVILQGVTIGKGAIIGAGAVVNRDIPAYSVAVGVPARVVGQRNADKQQRFLAENRQLAAVGAQ